MLHPRPLHEVEAAYAGADIYVYAAVPAADSLTRDIVQAFGRTRVRAFTDLADCISEAMDNRPQLILLDVPAIPPSAFWHLQRLRNDRACAHLPVLIRSAALNGAELARLVNYGASAVITASLQKSPALARIRSLLNGEVKPAQLPDKGIFKAIGDAQIAMCRKILPDDQRLERLRSHYGLDLDCLFMAQAGAGGDLWDVLPIDAHRLAVFTADFCGHGLHVAPNTLRLSSLMHSDGFDRADPSAVLGWLNQRLLALLPAGQFAAMAYAVIDLTANELAVSCSAHMPPLVRPAATAPWNLQDCSGLPLGFVADATFDTVRLPFGPGAGLLLYSDALVETPLPPFHRFDSQSLVEFCNSQSVTDTARALNRSLVDALNLNLVTLDDDLTILGLRRL